MLTITIILFSPHRFIDIIIQWDVYQVATLSLYGVWQRDPSNMDSPTHVFLYALCIYSSIYSAALQ